MLQQQQQAQQMQNPQQPQFDPNTLMSQAQEQARLVAQEEMRKAQHNQQIDQMLNDIAQRHKEDFGEDITPEKQREIMQFAVNMGQNPLQHAYQVMHYDRHLSKREEETRKRMAEEMRRTADPMGGGPIIGPEEPKAQALYESILNAD